MRFILFIFLLLIICLSPPLRAYQSAPSDSLIQLLDSGTVENDTTRINLLNKAAHQLLRIDSEKSKEYSLESIELSNILNFKSGLSRAIYLLGSYYWLKGDYSKAIKKYKEALAIAEAIDNSYLKAAAINGLGLTYVQLNDIEKGLNYLHEALEEAEKADDDILLSSILANLGWLHKQEENYDIAEPHFIRLAELAKENNNNQMLTISNSALGTLYKEKGLYDQALEYIQIALKTSKEGKDKDMEGYNRLYQGEIYAELSQHEKAEGYLLEAKGIFEDINSENRLLNVYASLAEFYSKRGRHDEASEVANIGLELSEKLQNNDYQPTFFNSLTLAKSTAGDFKGAFLLQKDFVTWNDSINAKKKNERIIELETIYQLEKIEDENELLKVRQENQANQIKIQYLIFIFVLAFLIFVGLTLRSRNRKNKELKIANEQVTKSSKVKQEFISTMSHEIRTPLNAVIGFTEILATEQPRTDQLEYINGLKTSSQHLLELINNVLSFSKIEAKKVELEHIPFDLQKQLQSIINTYRISNTNEDLSIELHSDLNIDQLILGDPTRLYQVLSNLLSNAVKFTKEGVVALEVTTLQQTTKDISLQFVVSDTGIGIPKEKQQLIFEDFIQGSNATTREFGGSGLGLSICQQLLELMDGQIQLKSEVGKGSEFSFNLMFPLAQHETQINLNDKVATSQKQLLKDQKILLAEDNLLNQKIALTLLQRNGATVTIANNGQEAVDYLRQQDFDLILMDLHMPVMDGFEAIDQIKALPFPKNETQIVVLTATATDIELKYPIDFIQKPFNIDQLIGAVQKNLSARV